MRFNSKANVMCDQVVYRSLSGPLVLARRPDCTATADTDNTKH